MSDLATARLTSFGRSTDEHPGLRLLAVHASLPVVVDAELLHHLRDNFLLDEVPVTPDNEAGMARLLLSPLFRPVEPGLYEMDPDVRTTLLEELRPLDGGDRIKDVARLIERYVVDGAAFVDRPELRNAQLLTAWWQLDESAARAWLDAGVRNATSGAGIPWAVAMQGRLEQSSGSPEDDAPVQMELARSASLATGVVVPVSASRTRRADACATRIGSSGVYVATREGIGLVTRSSTLFAHIDGELVQLQAVASGVSNTVVVLREIQTRFGQQTLPLSWPSPVVGDLVSIATALPPSIVDTVVVAYDEIPEVTEERLDLQGAVAPGATGSPVVNASGQVVGIVDTVAPNSTTRALVPWQVLGTLVRVPPAAVVPQFHAGLNELDADLFLHAAIVGAGFAPARSIEWLRAATDIVHATEGTRPSDVVFGKRLLTGAEIACESREQQPDLADAFIDELVRLIVRLGTGDGDALRAQAVGSLTPSMGSEAIQRLFGRSEGTPWPAEMSAFASEWAALVASLPPETETSPEITKLLFRLDPGWLDPMGWNAAATSAEEGVRLVVVRRAQLEPGSVPATWLREQLMLEGSSAAYQLEVANAWRSAAESLDVTELRPLPKRIESAMLAMLQRTGGASSQRVQVLESATKTARERLALSKRRRRRAPIKADWRLWPPDATLRVRFLNGSARRHARVRRIAEQWTDATSIDLAFLPTGARGSSDLRVQFVARNEAAWSFVGTDATTAGQDQPTMGLFPDEIDDELFDREVLEKFGLALGLLPEHQNPNADLEWDTDAVYRSFAGPPNNWSQEMIDTYVLRRFSLPPDPPYREFDPESVMLWTLPGELFLDRRPIGGGPTLSASDRAFIRRLYPPRPRRTERPPGWKEPRRQA